MNYSDLSDFEINKLVAEALGRFEFVSDLNIEGMGSAVLCDSLRTCDEYDFCNNPSDAWPIIQGSRISISPHCVDSNDNWEASLWCSDELGTVDIWHKNPLRAAMIVYLMMKDAENEV